MEKELAQLNMVIRVLGRLGLTRLADELLPVSTKFTAMLIEEALLEAAAAYEQESGVA